MKARTVVPWPGVLSIVSAPPCRASSFRLIAKPRPEPPNLRPIEASACWNGWPSDRSAGASMPIPVSVTTSAIASSGVFDAQRDDPTLRRELHGIGQQIEHDLLQRARVAAHGDTHSVHLLSIRTLPSFARGFSMPMQARTTMPSSTISSARS